MEKKSDLPPESHHLLERQPNMNKDHSSEDVCLPLPQTDENEKRCRRKVKHQECKGPTSTTCWKTRIPMGIIKLVVALYGILTFPIYFLLQRPWKSWQAKHIVWSACEDETGGPYVSTHQCLSPMDDVRTLDELFRRSTRLYGGRRSLGRRRHVAEADFHCDGGRIIRKFQSGPFEWMTYSEAARRVDSLCDALLQLGVRQERPIMLLSETRLEWMLLLNVCFRIGVPVVTSFSNIGEEGLIHSINETKVSHIFTSEGCIAKLKKVAGEIASVTHIVCMETLRPVEWNEVPGNITFMLFDNLESKTVETVSRPAPPSEEDVAIIMFTSGSTGVPKGVMMTHKNLVSMAANCATCVPFRTDDVYIAYLPTAHAFELCCEIFLLSIGAAIGYSSPLTLTDKSSGIIEGDKGDATLLKPEIMCVVPLMLDRIRKSVWDVVKQKSMMAHSLFCYAIEYKLYWYKKGFNTPILNRLVFKNIKNLLGGNLRVLVGGGAPLSPDTHDFVRVIFDVPVLMGYGMTESCAGVTIMRENERSTGRVGAPFGTGTIRLVDWPEGNYYVTDDPHPRGEILIGGSTVSSGYFNNDALNNECFAEVGGTRWIYTGDIGEVYPDGTLKIIDRKKDLVKLQNGEYISLGKVEAELKTCPLVDNICVIGNGFYNYLVAMVSPSVDQLKILAKNLNKMHIPLFELYDDREVVETALGIIKEHGQKSSLHRSEIPKYLKLCCEEWQPETGFVTAAFKIRRKFIEDFYRDCIVEMYKSNFTE